MARLISWLEKKMYPIAGFFQQNKYLSSIQYGLMLTIPLLLVGAFACIISDFPLAAYQAFMAGVFGNQTWAEWNWSVLNPATIGMMSLVANCGISYELARRNEVTPLPAVTISLMAFFLLVHASDGGIAQSEFGAMTLFLTIFVSVISGEVYAFCIKRDITIRMPESVPAFVSDQFVALVPAAINAALFLVIRRLIELTPYETATNLIYSVLQAPLTGITTSFPGTMIVTFLNSFIWWFGIHGTNVVQSVIEPFMYAARDANFQAFSADPNAVREFIMTADFENMVIYLTGTGLTLPLCVEMVFLCKSERLRAVGRGAIIPGIFNVNEPVIFGMPIVMNPIMLIPFVLSPMVCVALAYGAMAAGIVPLPTGVPVPWTLPFFFGGWMMCSSVAGGILQVMILLVSGLIYFPFIKAVDHQYLREEQEMEQAESGLEPTQDGPPGVIARP